MTYTQDSTPNVSSEVDIESHTSWSGEWIQAYLNARIELAQQTAII